jgi:hypothetical protein
MYALEDIVRMNRNAPIGRPVENLKKDLRPQDDKVDVIRDRESLIPASSEDLI